MRDFIREYDVLLVRSVNMDKWERAARARKFIESLSDAERIAFRRHLAAKIVAAAKESAV